MKRVKFITEAAAVLGLSVFIPTFLIAKDNDRLDLNNIMIGDVFYYREEDDEEINEIKVEIANEYWFMILDVYRFSKKENKEKTYIGTVFGHHPFNLKWLKDGFKTSRYFKV
jgi:hypothetical protein